MIYFYINVIRLNGHMDEIFKAIRDAVSELDNKENEHKAIRDKSERIVRECGRAVQLVHASDMNAASQILDSLKQSIFELAESNAPNVLIAQQEYVEAVMLYDIMSGNPALHYAELNVKPDAYLLGLSDLIGELRREIVEHLRKDDFARASELFDVMSGLYEHLLPVRYSNSILPGFRRKLDVSRSMVEQCRRDLLMFKISKNL